MRLVTILLLGLVITDGFPAAASPIEPSAPDRHWTRSERILLSIRRQLLSPASLDATKEDRTGLWTFYAGRANGPVWIAETGWTPRALAVIEEIKRAGDWGLDPSAFDSTMLSGAPELTERALADAEMRLSLAVLKYARQARGGRIQDPATQLTSYLDRKPQVRRPWLVITEIARADAPDAYLRGLNPQHEQFERLRQHYLARREGGGSSKVTIPEDGPKLAPGASHRDIALIRKRLGVPASNGEETLYDATLAEAVKRFQTKKDLSPANGVVNRKTRQALNANAGQQVSIKTILANMEQWRWMPEDLGETYVWVNVPEFTLRVVKDGKVVHTERIIVGTLNMQTPVFSEDLQTIYFHPRWYIPESIKLKEIAPRASSYIRRHGLRVARNGREIDPESVKWSGADIREYDIFQSPGPDNALGILKFTFPNKHAVYMHDTPNKDLFDAEQRTFSHGCVRVRNPARLAEVLLATDKDWNPARIAELIKAEPRENGVTLDKRIPVHITYFTAEVDDDGELVTQNDIYGHEKRITLALAGKWNEIDKGPDHLAQIELAQQLEDTPRPSRSYGGGGGNRGRSGWEPAAGVSRGVTANDIFRQNFGY